MKHFFYFIISLFTLLTFPLFAAESPLNATPYNIILIISDQERFNLSTSDLRLPARETLRAHGVTFTNHYTAAAMCSPSRATFLTGVPPQIHGIYDQEEYFYVPILDANRPNMGSILKKLGYRTAYFGKFEMNKTLLSLPSTSNSSAMLKPYGFDIFNPDGDVGGNPQQGYIDDPYFVGLAIRWLRANATQSVKNNKPFFLVISLLNPHDIMYGDANIPGTPQAQQPNAPVILPPPKNSLYAKRQSFVLSDSLQESLTAPGMPSALLNYQSGWAGTLGFIPTDRKDMWTFYYNYYLNALRDNDQNLQLIMTTLDDLALWKNTIVISTADHGEMGGAHGGLRGKGPMAYEENAHIPLIIAHPEAKAGSICQALTSHIDLLPTLIGLTGLSQEQVKPFQQKLPGHDFSSLLNHPETADIHAVRPGVLFNYLGISTIDAKFLLNTITASFTHKPLPPLTEVNLSRKGFLAFTFDGRYKYARFYSPDHFNTPETLDEIMLNNDVQLFDLKLDPNETNNLARSPLKYKAIILKMNALLNELMAKEVGVNNGSFLPESVRPKSQGKSTSL